MKVESKNKYVEIPFYLEQTIRKIIIYKARNNTARKPGDNRSGKNVQKSQVQACQLDIGWLFPVKINQASCLNNLSLVVGHVAGRKVKLGGCAVSADCVGFYARKFFRNHLFCSLSSVVLMSTTHL